MFRPIMCDSENCTSQCEARGKGKICPYLTNIRVQRMELEMLLFGKTT